MSKHTAGPWEYYKEEQKVTDLHGESFSLFFHSVKSKGFKDGGNIVRVGNEYDARLIAASPSLYKYVFDQAENGDMTAIELIKKFNLG